MLNLEARLANYSAPVKLNYQIMNKKIIIFVEVSALVFIDH